MSRSTWWYGVLALAAGCGGDAAGNRAGPASSGGAGAVDAMGTGGSQALLPPDAGPPSTADAEPPPGDGAAPIDGHAPPEPEGGMVFSPKAAPEECTALDEVTLQTVQEALDNADNATPAQLLDGYAVTFGGSLDYVASEATGMEIIQGSGLALTDPELAVLDEHGFVLSDMQRFPTFFYGYRAIYAEDLPLYVTVDSVLHAVHRSFDDILATLERAVLQPTLEDLLVGMRAQLVDASWDAQVRADLDEYLGVGLALLTGMPPEAVAGGGANRMQTIADLATQATGLARVDLFGTPRDVDFSQFLPRGHYVGGLEKYFRAMMWFGRVDLRMVETAPDHTPQLRRRQVAAALAVGRLLDGPLAEYWNHIDSTLTGFIGPIDYMTPPQSLALTQELGLDELGDLDGYDDAALLDAILDSEYGTQRIASHLMGIIGKEESAPLHRSFTLLGQRYTVDSEVLSNVVWDRVAQHRMMPDPLDAAFAALGNDQAAPLLEPQITNYDYAGELAGMRTLVDFHDCGYWDSSLYTLWMSALRELSPGPEVADPAGAGLPAIAGTESWGRRLLSTQLASWAELRHDTLLYAKQSYTGIPVCEFPDGYVDPYPEAFDRIAALALKGKDVVAALAPAAPPGQPLDREEAYFSHLYDVALLLREMATHERTGMPLTDEHMTFLNDAVVYKEEDVVCTTVDRPAGWYPKLFYDTWSADEYDPTIADVHTQPADEAGNIVGRVLHVGTGMPRLMITTVDTCTGPRAYAGVASSYFERITENFERLTDETWAADLELATPPDPAWLSAVIAR